MVKQKIKDIEAITGLFFRFFVAGLFFITSHIHSAAAMNKNYSSSSDRMTCISHDSDLPLHSYVYLNGNVPQKSYQKMHFVVAVHQRMLVQEAIQHCRHVFLPQSMEKIQHNFGFIIPTLAIAAIGNHAFAIPGYLHEKGLRGLFFDLSSFDHQDRKSLAHCNGRLETYITRIEAVLFNKKGVFQETLSFNDRVALAYVYADFLKEFCPGLAFSTFKELAQVSPAFEKVFMKEMNPSWWDGLKYAWWSLFGGDDVKSDCKRIATITAGTGYGDLRCIYKAIDNGDFTQALTLGGHSFHIKGNAKRGMQPTLFDSYPHLKQHVQQQAQLQKQQHTQQQAYQQTLAIQSAEKNRQIQCVTLHNEYNGYRDKEEWQSHQNILEKRLNALAEIKVKPDVFESTHIVSAMARQIMDTNHLTADKRGISLIGNALQHVLLDETITIADTVANLQNKKGFDLYSQPLSEAIIDLTNSAIVFNRSSDVVKASCILDSCWMMLDCLALVVDGARKGAEALENHITKPAIQGIVKGVENVVGMVTDPIGAAKNLVKALVMSSYYAGKITREIVEFDLLYENTFGNAEFTFDALQQLETNPMPVVHAIGEVAQSLSLSVDTVVEEIAKCSTEIILLHGLSKFCAFAGEGAVLLADNLCENARTGEMLMSVEGIPVRASHYAFESMKDIESVGAATGKIATAGGAQITEAEVLKIWQNSSEFIELNNKIEKLNLVTSDPHVRPLLDEVPVLKVSKLEKEAANFYDLIREINSDVMKISRNTNISKEIIQQIKDHIFIEEHILLNGFRRYDPCVDTAAAWERLMKGNFIQSDLRLLKHEYAELLIMQGDKIAYEVAHSFANVICDWDSYFIKLSCL